MLLFDPLFEFANLLAPAVGLALIVRQKAPASLNVLSHLLASNLARLAHDNTVLAAIAVEVKNAATLFTVFTGHHANSKDCWRNLLS
jgi:hypothetical protein